VISEAVMEQYLMEDELCFEIGERTFPEVLSLADDIKACVTLMRKVKE
jgi:hypothetical protein